MIVPAVCWNPVFLILHNTKLNRWHPILFWECPPPSGHLGACFRWKSRGHHTSGFPSLAEAEKYIHEHGLPEQHKHKQGGHVYFDTDQPVEWNGEGTPAAVLSFELSKLYKYEPPVEEPK